MKTRAGRLAMDMLRHCMLEIDNLRQIAQIGGDEDEVSETRAVALQMKAAYTDANVLKVVR